MSLALPGVSTQAAPGRPPPSVQRLQNALMELIGGLEIGLDLRHLHPEDGTTYWRIGINAEKLYPVASCFKAPLLLYYFWYTPPGAWQTREGFPAHSVAVFSNNLLTGTLMQQVAGHVETFGNPIQKFNDFLLFRLGFTNGLYSWNWEGSPTQGLLDDRFAPSPQRYVEAFGRQHRMDNIVTAAELANFYALLLHPNPFPATETVLLPDVITATLDLLAIPAPEYEAPLERTTVESYIGKDGVIPAEDSSVGRVINDAGIITVGGQTFVLAYLCAGEGEATAISVLRQVVTLLEQYVSEL